MESGYQRRILVGWDDESEVDLLSMYLEAGDNESVITRDPEELLRQFREIAFDVVVFPVTFPDADKALELFQQLMEIEEDVAVIAAARPGEIYALSRFIRRGLSTHIYRDPAGEYLFLLQTLIDSALEGRRAARQRDLVHRLREEVDSVRRLQETIIPKSIKALRGFEVAARYEPSQIRTTEGNPIVLAGGDYYDAFRIDEERMLLLVGDASGHGMKACMSIMSLHTLVNQIHDNINRPPHELVAEINRQLCTTELIQSEGGFITLLLGILARDHLSWTSAGHCLPLLHCLESNEIIEIGDPREHGGPPLGVFEESEYVTVNSPFPAGHRMLIYTDGLAEAFPVTDSHVEFGVNGIRETMIQHGKAEVGAALDALFIASNEFTQGSGRHDDTSALMLEHRTGP